MGGRVLAGLDSCVRMVDSAKVVISALPRADDLVELADVFRLLGDAGRLSLLVALLEGGELCVCDLAATTAMAESAVSHALRLLRAHRVVTVSRRGRMAYYRLADGHVRMVLDVGLAHMSHTTALHADPGDRGSR